MSDQNTEVIATDEAGAMAAPEPSLSEPSPPETSPLDTAGAALIAACETVLRTSRETDTAFARARLGDLRSLLDRLDPATLIPRRGLAGLFDGRRKRLRRFRGLVLDAAPALSSAAVKLRDAGGELARRIETLDEGHNAVRERLAAFDALMAAHATPTDAGAAVSGEPPLTELMARLERETRAAEAESGPPGVVRAAGLRALPLIRMIQNADLRLADMLTVVSGAATTWRDETLAALGADGNRLKPLGRVQPDAGALSEARAGLGAALERLEVMINAAAQRRDEAIKRIDNDIAALRQTD